MASRNAIASVISSGVCRPVDRLGVQQAVDGHAPACWPPPLDRRRRARRRRQTALTVISSGASSRARAWVEARRARTSTPRSAPGRLADLPSDRGDRDDQGQPVCLDHDPGRGPGDEEGPGRVDLRHAPPLAASRSSTGATAARAAPLTTGQGRPLACGQVMPGLDLGLVGDVQRAGQQVPPARSISRSSSRRRRLISRATARGAPARRG